jgi:hypothetical protein
MLLRYISSIICDEIGSSRYKGYKVFRVTPTSESGLHFMKALKQEIGVRLICNLTLDIKHIGAKDNLQIWMPLLR